jgi:hypothetical protein
MKRPASFIAIISTEISTASAKKTPKIGISIRESIKK